MKNSSPPKLFLKFFRWYCHPKLAKHIEGDLMEVYHEQLRIKGKTKADIQFVIDVLLLFRPGIVRSRGKYHALNNTAMFKNYVKIGWRNLLKNKGYSFINIAGLALGMAFTLVIALWIQHELSFDSSYVNAHRIALVQKNTFFNDERNTQEATPYPLCDELKNNYPEVKRASKVSYQRKLSLMAGDRTVSTTGRFVDPDFLEMFSLSFAKGNGKTALQNTNSIILTESSAIALFGTTDPMGNTVKVNNQFELQVTGVIKDVRPNSTLQFDFLAPYEFEAINSPFINNNRTNWSNNFLMNVVELRDGVSMEEFSAKIKTLNMDKDNTLKNQTLFLHPLKKWHLYNDYKNWVNVGGRIEYVKLFGAIGGFVLLIACINFMNLSTARSQKRAKEVGIRKTLGSQRSQIISQFLSESMLTAFIGFVFSICIVTLTLPYLETLGFENINLSVENSFILIFGLGICIITGLVAGSYPALYLSSFLPVKVLKGIFKQGKSPITFRRVLVVSQFAISVGLITSTIIVFQQVEYARNRSIGYNPDNLISINASRDLYLNFAALKQDLLTTGYVEAVATTSSPMTAVYNVWSDFSWEGKDPDSQIALEALMTEWDFEKVARLKFKLGRPFSIRHASDSNGIILNESALKVIGYKDPIGRTMKSGDREVTIVGVVEDLLMRDPFKPVSPGVILFNAEAVNTILVRVKENTDLKEVLTAMQPIFEKHNPAEPFEYTFVDEDFNKKFALENQVGKLAGIFAALAIFISFLGLFGLASYIAEQRVKEIGIRKVLGASVANLWKLLSKDFIILVLISCCAASPIAYYFMNNWLMKYEYRTDIALWIFLVVGGFALIITLATVSYHALKASLANPVKSLRSE
ncbi:ABC transporter permease [Chryseolinea sp. H1M3-3]|uniref:ABC transporter permease n=1 Tax=Chryseolinea sp. H1M3-3 TaxID=3034144 RepID=UPI0023EB91A5|nr:ABC transporter permease [Chryseolinea sp. H1M3-3]